MDSNHGDSLEHVPIEKWSELQEAFLKDWPRGLPAYNALVTQKKLADLGLDYGFKVYCPRGDPSSGMVAVNKKGTLNEIIIQCPNDNTSVLEESLANTKLIPWRSRIMVPFAPQNIRLCIQKVAQRLNLCIDEKDMETNDLFLLNNESPLYEVFSIPQDTTIKEITGEHDISKADSFWRNRYDGSVWLFNILAQAKHAYGLYKNEDLVSWVFINEVGALTHLFTLENHRKKGYGEALIKYVSNICLKEKRPVYAYCRQGNIGARKLYEKLGFDKFFDARWCFIN